MRNYDGMNILIKFQLKSQKYWHLKENKSPVKYICVVTINTLVLPYLNYCNMIWTAASESLLNKLQVLQKKAVRIVY